MGDDVLAVVPDHLRRPLGRTLVVAAITGAVVALALAGLGWRVVGAVDEVSAESAAVTADALLVLDETLVLAADLITTVDGTLVALRDALTTTTDSIGAGGDALESVATLSTDAAPALASATSTLRTLTGVGDTIDATLRGLSVLPFGPEYDPERSFGDTIEQLADDLEPLSDDFARTAADLEAVAGSTAELEEDLASLATSLGDATDRLAASDELVAEYRATAARVRALAEDAAGAFGAELVLLRVLVVLGGVAVAVGQLVPWLIGRGLLADRPPAEPREPATG